MNSKTLIEAGFCEWLPLKTLDHSHLPADKAIVVAIVDKELSGKSESDILYIGRTKKPTKRILGGYLAGYGGKNAKKINQKLLCEGYMDKAVISWVITDKPRIMQEELLAKYKEAHGMLPAWNMKKQIAKPKPASKLKQKETPVLRVKASASKAATTPRNVSKAKPSSRRSAAKAEAPKETMPSTETPEKSTSSGTETSAPT
jgi:hypothetical protein